jgi:hypothetical protein
VLQPFGFSMYQGSKFLVSLLFGAVTFGCSYVFGLLEKPLQKHYKKKLPKSIDWLIQATEAALNNRL